MAVNVTAERVAYEVDTDIFVDLLDLDQQLDSPGPTERTLQRDSLGTAASASFFAKSKNPKSDTARDPSSFGP